MTKSEVIYKGNIILRSYKDPTTNLWTLPLTPNKIAKTTLVEVLISPNSAHMMLSHHVEHTKAPISHAVIPEQLSPCVMLDGCTTKTTRHNPAPVKSVPLATPLLKLPASLTHKPTKPTTLNLHTKAYATHPLHPSSRQSMLDSSRGARTWMRTQYKSISLPVQPH
jgi:hypothetical protein